MSSRFGLDGQLAIVTGGGSGIGAGIARAFAAAGAHVAVLDRDGERAAAVAASCGAATAVTADVTDHARIEAIVAELAARHGRIDVLVNAAGIAIRVDSFAVTPAEWERVVAVNMTAVFFCSRTAAAVMARAGHGAIVNIASVMGLSGGLYPNASYQTTKGAVVNMTRALAVEWAPHGVRVNAVAPTWVRTPLTERLLERPGVLAAIEAATPLGRLASIEEVADATLFLAAPAAAMITGHTLPVDGGFLAR